MSSSNRRVRCVVFCCRLRYCVRRGRTSRSASHHVINEDPRRAALRERASTGLRGAAEGPALSALARHDPGGQGSAIRERLPPSSQLQTAAPGTPQRSARCGREASKHVAHQTMPSAPVSCVHRKLDLETGSSDVVQRSVINHRPSYIHTAALPSTMDSRSQPAEKRGEQADPPAPVRGFD